MSKTIKLNQVAHGRSGDKGNHANIGIIAFDESGFEHLQKVLTADLVTDYFADLKPTKVERFELPGIKGFNFLLHEVLDGGGSYSLRIDSQGKTFAMALLEIEIPAP